MNKAYKCQTYDDDSFIDCLYVVFCQSYLVNAVGKYMKDSPKEFTSRDRPHVLEIGCYNGRLRIFMDQQRYFVDYTGVDVRPDYIERCKYKNSKRVNMLCEDVTEGLSVESGSVDVCVSSEVIEHIHESKHEAMIQNIHRTLKVGGRLVIGFPINTKEKKFHLPEREQNLGHVNFPVYEDFAKMVESIGFKMLDYQSSYSIKSSYRISKESKESEMYKKLREGLGGPVARAVMMTLEDEQTGGGIFTFEKIQ